MTKKPVRSLALSLAVPVAVLPILFASPGGHAARAGTDPDRGTVTGVLELVGGPYPGIKRPEPGRVIAQRHDRASVSVRTSKHGRYVLHLVPGRYVLSGKIRGGGLICHAAHPVTVRADITKHINVVCPVP
jgi:hypothetical protein